MDLRSRIESLDAQGYTVIEALTHNGAPATNTLSRACVFTCVDGHSYWTKSTAQQGLVSEIIAGRLANQLHAAPYTQIVHVSLDARPLHGGCDHIDGVVFGSRDMDGTVNARDLASILGQAGAVVPIHAPSRARVVAFQTWIGVGDSQVLIRLTDGQVFSLDHGEAFGGLNRIDPALTVTPIPGVGHEEGRAHVDAAAHEIEQVSDDDIAKAVARIPSGGAWKAPLARRAEIAEFLIERRSRVRETLGTW